MTADTRARVLIIEDDSDIATFEETMLTRANYHAKVAYTGADGLALVESFKPDVVLLDIGLPDMSGLDVCTTIAETADAYILMVSGHSGEDVKLTGLGLGADDFISKPFSGNELVARIGSFLRRRERARLRDNDGRLQLGDAALVRDLHTLEKGTRSVSLTALEFRLLWFLAKPTADSSRARRSSNGCGTTSRACRRASSTCTSRRCARSSARSGRRSRFRRFAGSDTA